MTNKLFAVPNSHGLRLQDRLVLPELNVIATNGISVHVEPKVMAVLLELAKRPGEVVSKAELIKSVWAGVFVCEDVVTNALCLLRRALADDAKRPSLIQTIPKRGYRLLSPVVRESTDLNIPEPPSGRTLRDSLSLTYIDRVTNSATQPSDLDRLASAP
jgi:DNA-binding winged helix-turn-helix (wHTH) protein